jgi:outer membrane lipoprotein-sorting protein
VVKRLLVFILLSGLFIMACQGSSLLYVTPTPSPHQDEMAAAVARILKLEYQALKTVDRDLLSEIAVEPYLDRMAQRIDNYTSGTYDYISIDDYDLVGVQVLSYDGTETVVVARYNYHTFAWFPDTNTRRSASDRWRWREVEYQLVKVDGVWKITDAEITDWSGG